MVLGVFRLRQNLWILVTDESEIMDKGNSDKSEFMDMESIVMVLTMVLVLRIRQKSYR